MKILLTLMLLLVSPAWAANSYTPLISMLKEHTLVVVRADATSDETDETLIRVDTDLAADWAGTQILSYDSHFSTMKVLDAYTVTPSGQRIRVGKSAIRIQSEPVSDGSTKFSDMKNLVIVFPKVEKGSQIYYRVRTHYFKNLYPGYFATHQVFQPHYRRADSQVELRAAPNIRVNIDAPGMTGGQLADLGGMKRWVYRHTNDTAQPPEPNQVNSRDFSPGFYASNYSSWESFGKLYDQGAASAAKVTPKVQALADKLTHGITDRREQAKALYHWVSRNIRYVLVSLGNGGMAPHSADSILDNRYGDCKDHATLLQALLAAKGIPSSQVLISSGDAYVLPKVPGMSVFNHAINYIPELDLYLDSTAQTLPFGTLHDGEYDKPVVLTALGKLARTPVARAQDHQLVVDTTLEMQPDGKIKGRAHATGSGNEENNLRLTYHYYAPLAREKAVNDILLENGETGTGDFKTNDPLDLSIPFSIDAEFLLDAPANVPGPSGITAPRGITPGRLYSVSQLKLPEERRFPRVCNSISIQENITLSFPAGIRVESIPVNTEIKQPGITYRASYQLKNNTVTIQRSYVRQNERGYCDPSIQESDKRLLEGIKRDLRAQIVYR